MTVREYIGARYVPLFMGDWDNSATYEPLSIVQYQGNSYTSRQSVPVGIEITNTVYWALTGNYNAQVEQYRQEVQTVADSLDDVVAKTKYFYFTSEIDDMSDFLSENPEGYLFVDSDVICANYIFPKTLSIVGQGGILSGIYTIEGAIATDRKQVFDVTSNITIDSEVNPIGYPEWFGAKGNDDSVDNSSAIAKCVETFAQTELAACDYYIESTIEIKTSYRTLNGITAPTNIDSSNYNGTRIVVKDGGINALSIGNTSDRYSVTQVHVNDFTIINLSPDWESDYHALEMLTVRGTYINHIVAIDFNVGFYIYGAVLSYIDKCRNIITKPINDENNAYGYYCDCDAPAHTNMISPIASLFISACDMTDLNTSLNSYGFAARGSNGIADLSIKDCIFSGVYNGALISGNQNEYQQDIYFCNNVVDNVTVGVHVINNVKATIENNWISLGARVGVNASKRALWIETNTNGLVIFKGNTIKENKNNTNTAMGVRAANANNLTIADNSYINIQKAHFIGPANNVVISGESVFNEAGKDHQVQLCDISDTKNASIEIGAYGTGSWLYGITITSACEDICVQPSRLPVSMLDNACKVRYAGSDLTNTNVLDKTLGTNIMILGNVV